MKYILPIVLIVAIFYGCSPSTISNADNTSDSSSTRLSTFMKIKGETNGSDRPILIFTVKNPSDSVLTFCKWHTPFEPLMSKYLDIKNTEGKEMDYKGAMAKRIMPPPADSYLSIKAGDSLSVEVDLLKGYAIEENGTYSLKYVGENMSGLVVKDSVVFNFKR